MAVAFLSSCSQLNITSTPGTAPMYVGLQDEHGTPVEVVLEKSFYLWGLVPAKHEVKLDKEFQELGAVGVARLSYRQEQTWSQWFLGVLSFGLYWPVELRIQGLAKMGEDSSWKKSRGRWR